MPVVSPIRTWRDAIEQLDMEQQDAVRALVDDKRDVDSVSRGIRRDVPETLDALAVAFVYLGRRLQEQARGMRVERAREQAGRR